MNINDRTKQIWYSAVGSILQGTSLAKFSPPPPPHRYTNFGHDTTLSIWRANVMYPPPLNFNFLTEDDPNQFM